MNTAVIVAIVTFLVVFVAVCGVAWIVVSRRGRGDTQLPPTLRQRPSTVAVALTVAAGIVSFVVVIAAARLSLSLFEPLLAGAAAQFWAIFFNRTARSYWGLSSLLRGCRSANVFAAL